MNTRKFYVFASILLVGLLLALWSGKGWPITAQSQKEPTPSSNQSQAISTPPNILFSYQGQLLSPDEEPINGPVDMLFSLYNQQTGGTALWRESYVGTNAVSVTNGLFHVYLGSVTPISPTDIINGELFLELTIEDETLTPRELLTSVAYAVEASTVPDGAITTNKLNIDAPVQMNGNALKGGIIWPSSYGHTGSQTALPGFMDTLYYAVERGLTVETNRDPDGGKLSSMFNLHANSSALWNNVAITNPVVMTITYGSDMFLNGVSIAFGWRNSHAIDYTVDYYEDSDDDGTYEWIVIAEVLDNEEYQVYYPVRLWGVQKIRITVTDAGDSSETGKLRVATIQALSGIYGKDTGHLMDVGGDTMYGGINMNSNSIANIEFFEVDGGGQSIFNSPQDVTKEGNAALRFGGGGNWLGIDNNEIVSYGDPLHLQASDADTSVQVHTDLGVDGYVALKTASSDWARIEGHGKDTGDDGGMDFKLGDDSGVNFRWYVNGQERMELAGNGNLNLSAGTEIFWADSGQIRSSDDNHRIVFNRPNDQLELREYGAIYLHAGGENGGDADLVVSDSQIDVKGNAMVNCGAFVEANLQTTEELETGRIDRFEEGDVLCWGMEQLELCSIANDRLVQAVADNKGRPIVLGAEVVKILGPVQRGDILVTSDMPGYAMVNNDPISGSVIAQALEDFDGEAGVIKAMIRKW